MDDGHGAGPPLAVIYETLSATKYTFVASAVVLLWDMMITFDDEIKGVWKARKTIGTTLFFLNRYIPPTLFIFDLYAQFVQSPSITFCKNYQLSSTTMDIVSIAIVEAILIMRTHALYRGRTLFIILSIFGVLSIVNMLAFFFVVFQYETFVPASTLGFRGCLSGCTSPLCQPLLIAFWVPFYCFETMIFALTAWKSYTSYRTMRLFGSASIASVIIRDGLIYYLVIMAISSCNFLIWIIDPFASYLAVGLQKSLQATICSRLLLNLRGMLDSRGVNRSRGLGTSIGGVGLATGTQLGFELDTRSHTTNPTVPRSPKSPTSVTDKSEWSKSDWTDGRTESYSAFGFDELPGSVPDSPTAMIQVEKIVERSY